MATSGADQSGSFDHVGPYEEALARFAEGLQELHINCDAPAFRDITEKARHSGRVSLSVSAISEALSGRRLPSIDFTLELVRQLAGNNAEVQQKWREQWRTTKQLQRRAQPALREQKRAKEDRTGISQQDIENLRTQETALRREVERLQAEAQVVSSLISEAHAEAERVLTSAREEANRILATADNNLLRVRNHAAELLHAADEALGRSLSRENAPIEKLRTRTSLHIALLGPPGAGKGTQAAFLAKYLRVPHISLGELLRHHISHKTDLGRHARHRIDRGQLLEDELTLTMVLRRLEDHDAQRGFLLDGMPRNLRQAALTDDAVRLDTVLEIAVPEQETLIRLTNRRVCTRDSSHVYHLIYNPNKSGDICDICGAPIYLRDDDSEGIIRQRLEVHKQITSPVIDSYKERGIVSTISGLGKVHEVTERAIKALADAAA
ncbi:nucleoside monophosphate kinase [Streptomyces sp. NPDC049936]|uniref:adenylate kinase family protein n=1 Tax=Streptomyces sp. NPDC049936 TaxID=3365599 RepID=UPI00379F223A